MVSQYRLHSATDVLKRRLLPHPAGAHTFHVALRPDPDDRTVLYPQSRLKTDGSGIPGSAPLVNPR